MVFARLRERLGEYKRWALGQKRLRQKEAEFDTITKECSRSCGSEAAREVVEAVCRAYNGEVCPDYTDDQIYTAREKWAEILHTMHKHGKYSSGNDVQILEGGDTCFPVMLEAIDSAKDRVWMESYIFDGSSVAETFYDALVRAKGRGVDVILILDACGGSAFRKEWLEHLRSIGVPVVVFNPMVPFLTDTIGPPCFRDHRKILVADNTGFCGSMNIHQETCSPKMGGDGHFYDVHSRMRGPCVKDLADVFISSLKESGSDIVRSSIPDVPAVAEPGMYVQVLNSCVRRQDYGLQKSLQLLLRSADQSVIIASAYFTPPGFLRRTLIDTITRRKVKTSLLVSGNSDFWPIPGDLMAQTHAVRQFVGLPGCDVSMYGAQHMHAKYSSFDGVYSFLGSNNFDRYSTRRNLECSIGVMDRGFAEGIRSIHEDKKHKGFKPSLDDWYFSNSFVRLGCFIAYYCLKLSGQNIVDGLNIYNTQWRLRKELLVKALNKEAGITVATGMMWGLAFQLNREVHTKFLKKALKSLPTKYCCLDASRPWFVYWILRALELLGNLDRIEVADDMAGCDSSSYESGDGVDGVHLARLLCS
ncbi:hypothetical protein FOL46_008126 [Perkinsus olseni]|uniref:PLD phosphodiesterase domain-containing protein n=1 Tax=Perkinsus olseni TaxID=32597 RepID=A0A7J6L949_PEROL|nr:hypothetical protein FOL46_008126 [Perkinsus olseni]